MIQSEMNQLIRLNSKLLGSQALGRFREQSVYCTARSGQKITFTPPSEIVGTLAMVLEEFNSLIAGSETVEEISFAMSYFWMGFIATHPFMNGNGRTAKAYLEQKAKTLGLEINLAGIDGILLEQDPQQNIQLLYPYFFQNLKQLSTRTTP
ncbi:MAG: Fic family protein [Proteobacteria bacterium]|nr:Fic family protein [Pseudomonadota bacterium]